MNSGVGQVFGVSWLLVELGKLGVWNMESEQGKLFVGGISRETSEDILKEHFSRYGIVLGSVVAKDRCTKNPRGFGFVWFSDSSSADKALQDTHVILGRTVEVKKAIPRGEQHQNHQQQLQKNQPREQQNFGEIEINGNGNIDNQFRTKKIFVGGLSASLTEEEFKNYFERFGRITDVVVMHDSMTNRPRGFGFVTFDSEESVENVMQKNFHELNSRFVEVKRAVPKEGIHATNSNSNTQFGVGTGPSYNSSQFCEYPPNSPAYGMLPGYGPPSGYTGIGGFLYGMGVYGCGYPMVGYDGVGYVVPPLAPRSPWYPPVMPGTRICSLPYGNAPVYPAYMNGGVDPMGMVGGGYNAIGGPGLDLKLDQVVGGNGHLPVDSISTQFEGLKLDIDSLGLNKTGGGASSKQKRRGLDGKPKTLHVDVSR